jgi:hypothetical protein
MKIRTVTNNSIALFVYRSKNLSYRTDWQNYRVNFVISVGVHYQVRGRTQDIELYLSLQDIFCSPTLDGGRYWLSHKINRRLVSFMTFVLDN